MHCRPLIPSVLIPGATPVFLHEKYLPNISLWFLFTHSLLPPVPENLIQNFENQQHDRLEKESPFLILDELLFVKFTSFVEFNVSVVLL